MIRCDVGPGASTSIRRASVSTVRGAGLERRCWCWRRTAIGGPRRRRPTVGVVGSRSRPAGWRTGAGTAATATGGRVAAGGGNAQLARTQEARSERSAPRRSMFHMWNRSPRYRNTPVGNAVPDKDDQPVTGLDPDSLPLDRAGRLRRDVVGHPVHARHLPDDARGDRVQHLVRAGAPSRPSSRPRWSPPARSPGSRRCGRRPSRPRSARRRAARRTPARCHVRARRAGSPRAPRGRRRAPSPGSRR